MKKKNFFVKENLVKALAFVLIFIFVIFVISSFTKTTKSLVLYDNCGPMPDGKTISHTIKDADDCRIQCRGQCGATDLEYESSEFNYANGSSCYVCSCTCVN